MKSIRGVRLVSLAGFVVLTGCGGSSGTPSDGSGSPSTGGAGGSVGAGGSNGGGGSAGAANHNPLGADKVDVVLLIDNSSGMGTKQTFLSQSIGDLINRLTDPLCLGPVDPATNLPSRVASAADGTCPKDAKGNATQREFAAIADIHLAVVSSSLGGVGGDACAYDPSMPNTRSNNVSFDGHGHPISAVLGADDTFSMQVASYVSQSGTKDDFLAWDPGSIAKPPTPANAGTGQDTDGPTLIGKLSSLVVGAGVVGCGFEQQMEGWYRFLIDPTPPVSVTGGVGPNGPLGPTIGLMDTVLLQQRADFLRPDSAVVIVVLSDENEHSVILGALPSQVCEKPTLDSSGNPTGACSVSPSPWPDAYRIADNFNASGNPDADNFAPLQIFLSQETQFPAFSGTAACATDPYSPDCKECLSGQGSGASDPSCVLLSGNDDAIDLRQWDMKRRFGWDAEYPVQRYVDGLHETAIYDTTAAAAASSAFASKVQNPLYDDLPFNAANAAGKPLARPKFAARDPKLVYLTTIVGVPWQDLANTNPATGKPDLSMGYVSASKIDWSLVVGDPYNTDPSKRNPGDPLMIEAQNRDAAITAAGGKHPITGEPLGHTAWNSINGHEWEAYNGFDLQYTCLIALPAATDCTEDLTCDCAPPDPTSMDPAQLQALDNPTCEPLVNPADPSSPGAGQAAITGAAAFKQYRQRAYSGRRYLQVLKGLDEAGGNAVAASICARNVAFADPAHANDPDLGYRPAIDALLESMKPNLKPD